MGWRAQRNEHGTWILDSPLSNATSHFLHNSLFVLGKKGSSAAVDTLQAELYRANTISNFDAAVHCRTTDNVDIYFYTAHLVEKQHDVEWCYEFEHGVITYSAAADHPDSGRIIGRVVDHHGATIERIDYGNPDVKTMKKIWDCIDALNLPKDQATVACTAATARSHVVCVNAAQESMPDIVTLTDLQEREDNGTTLIYHPDILPVWQQCYKNAVMPSSYGWIDQPISNTLMKNLESYVTFSQSD